MPFGLSPTTTTKMARFMNGTTVFLNFSLHIFFFLFLFLVIIIFFLNFLVFSKSSMNSAIVILNGVVYLVSDIWKIFLKVCDFENSISLGYLSSSFFLTKCYSQNEIDTTVKMILKRFCYVFFLCCAISKYMDF